MYLLTTYSKKEIFIRFLKFYFFDNFMKLYSNLLFLVQALLDSILVSLFYFAYDASQRRKASSKWDFSFFYYSILQSSIKNYTELSKKRFFLRMCFNRWNKMCLFGLEYNGISFQAEMNTLPFLHNFSRKNLFLFWIINERKKASRLKVAFLIQPLK